MGDGPTSQDTSHDTDTDPAAASTSQRLEDLEHRQDTLTEKVDEILGLVRGRGRASEPSAPPAGGASADSQAAASVAEQVQAELAREREAAQRQAAADADKADREAIKEQLARLQETPPRPKPRRATALLGWGTDR